jgi:hypothetical protein
MSRDAVAEFFRLLEDPSVHQACDAAMQGAAVQALLDFASEHDLDFTAEELADHLEEYRGLTDEQLEEIAGGLPGQEVREARTMPYRYVKPVPACLQMLFGGGFRQLGKLMR